MTKTFWVDVVNTMAYLINRRASFPLGFKISEEEMARKDNTSLHLTVFRFVAYVKDVNLDNLKLSSVTLLATRRMRCHGTVKIQSGVEASALMRM